MRWTIEQDAVLTEAWHDRVPVNNIAADMGLTPGQIKGRARTLNLPMRQGLTAWMPRPETVKWNVAEALDMHRRGKSDSEIARHFGLVGADIASRLALAIIRERKPTTLRKCLACGDMFPSEGPGNRRCGPCKNTLAFRECSVEHAPAGFKLRA